MTTVMLLLMMMMMAYCSFFKNHSSCWIYYVLVLQQRHGYYGFFAPTPSIIMSPFSLHGHGDFSVPQVLRLYTIIYQHRATRPTQEVSKSTVLLLHRRTTTTPLLLLLFLSLRY
jgi:hypothetical protein